MCIRDSKSISLTSDVPLDLEKFQTWFGQLLQSRGQDILRSKGILNFKGEEDRYVFQGVHMIFSGKPDRPWGSLPRRNQLVFIGRNLDEKEMRKGFEDCLV